MKYFNYACIVLGAAIAFYASNGEQTNTPLLLIGMVLLVIGVYRLSKGLPSRGADTKEPNNKSNDA